MRLVEAFKAFNFDMYDVKKYKLK